MLERNFKQIPNEGKRIIILTELIKKAGVQLSNEEQELIINSMRLEHQYRILVTHSEEKVKNLLTLPDFLKNFSPNHETGVCGTGKIIMGNAEFGKLSEIVDYDGDGNILSDSNTFEPPVFDPTHKIAFTIENYCWCSWKNKYKTNFLLVVFLPELPKNEP